MKHRPLSPLDFAALACTCLIGSFTAIMVRLAVDGDPAKGQIGIPPLLGGALRFGIAGLVIFLALAFRKKLRPIARRDWWRVLLLAMVCVPVNQIGFWYGVHFANASHGAIIYSATPVVVTIATCCLGVEKFSFTALSGAFLATAGVAVILLQSGLHLSMEFLKGDLYLILAMATWALYLVGARPLTLRYGSLSSQMWVFLTGTLLCVPFVFHDLISVRWLNVAPRSFVGLGYLAIMVAVVNFFLFNWCMTRQPPSRVASFSNAAYPLTIVWTSFFGDKKEHLNLGFAVGAAILLAGMIFTLLRPPATAVPEESSPMTIAAD